MPADPTTKGPTAAERARALVCHCTEDAMGEVTSTHARRCDALTSRVTPLVEALERILARTRDDRFGSFDGDDVHYVNETADRALTALGATARGGR